MADTKSSRTGTKEDKAPFPLRFDSVDGAKEHIRANKLKVKEKVLTRRGLRIQVVDPKGKPRTITVERKKSNGNGD